jgi:hypothetical protein
MSTKVLCFWEQKQTVGKFVVLEIRIQNTLKVKVQQSHYRSGQALRVPEG